MKLKKNKNKTKKKGEKRILGIGVRGRGGIIEQSP